MNELRSKNVDNEPCQVGLVSWLVNVPSPAISDSAAIDSFADAQTTFMNTDGDFAISSEYFKKIDWSKFEEAGFIRVAQRLRRCNRTCNRVLVELPQHV